MLEAEIVTEGWGSLPQFSVANTPQNCFDYSMRAGEVSYRAHAAGSCPTLTNDFRSPVSSRVRHTGRPLRGQALPFMRTKKPREGKDGRNSRIFRFLFL